MSYAIEKDIPIEEYNGKWKQLTAEMQRGDSVLMSDRDSKSFREHLRRKGILSVVRKNKEFKTADEEYRVWRRT
jgi:hypothetical protein